MGGLLGLIVALALAPPPPAADVALPRTPEKLAVAFTETTRRLRHTGWDGTNPVPDDVTLLALHHQRILRRMAESRELGDATLARLPGDVKGEARATVLAGRDIDAIARGTPQKVTPAPAAPANELRAIYGEAGKRFGIDWSTLAAVNLVESAFG